MDKRELKIDYFVYQNDLPFEYLELCDRAKQAASNAYSIYSGFSVGAAVLLENGEIISGNNQENVAYPSGLCAERTALFYATSQYPDIKINAIALVAFDHGHMCQKPVSPCGACRQVMVEIIKRFGNDFEVIMIGGEQTYLIKASCLLPFAFEM